ncbi:MAG: Asp-tRNA(Asn)/Glu-tRNA(Gln) amidotransferase subunit GatC [Chloroflexi bacterium]|nr:Asp-tRNA(Asn)/Glu-tRNA(Gln) amidotransferase subunit GatC [Chloroflexota bacterium]
MPLSRQDVEHVAWLARLELTDEEIQRLQVELSAILEYARMLEQIDVSQVPPTATVLPMRNVMRDDEVAPSLPRDVVLANAPDQEEGYFRVPPVLETE